MLQATAQQEQKAFFVYRNDGDFNVMFFSEVDSIVYSQLDVDSMLCDEYVTQEIWTADTVVRIPVASIDSVSFREMPTIYKEGISVIKDDLTAYIISVDSLTINLRSDIPDKLLPEVGNKLVSTSTKEPLPNGFRGIVKNIENIGDTVKIHCNILPVEDAFKQYCSIRSILVYDKNSTKKNAFGLDKIYDETFNGEPFVLPVPESVLGFTKNNEISETCKESFGLSFSNKLELTFTPTRRIMSSFIVFPDGEIDVTFSYWDETIVDWDWDLAGTFSVGKERKLPIPEIPLGGGANCYIDLGVGCSVEGGIATSFSLGQTFETYAFVKYNSKYTEGNTVKLIPKFQLIPSFKHVESVFGNLSGKLYAFAELGVDYVSKKLDRFGIRFQGGPVLNTSVPLYLKKTNLQEKNTENYEALIENSYCSLSGKLGGSMEFSLFDGMIPGIDISMSIPFWEKDLGTVLEWNYVPSFSNTSFLRDATTKQFRVNTKVDNKLLFPVNVGTVVFDDTDDTYKMEYFADYRNPDTFKDYDMYLDKVKPNHSYKAYPVINWFGHNLLAKPYAELAVSITPVTEEATEATYDSAILTGRVKGEISLIDDTYKFGFLYSTTSDGVMSGTKILCKLNNENSLSHTLTNLNQNTTYYYCAFIETDGERFYGSTMSFETPKIPDDAVDLGLSVLWAKYNVGANTESQPGGLYGWADATGTVTSIDVVGNDGVTWVSPLYGGVNPPKNICGNPSYDIAANLWGNGWRLPSQSEMAELINNCTTEYEVVEGTAGLRFTSVINGNSVFFPFAGDRFGMDFRNGGEIGYYWTGTLVNENNVNAHRMTIDGYGAIENNYPRYIGNSVRAVRPKE